MVFDNSNAGTDGTMTFSLTLSEASRVRFASFIQKDEILDQMSRWTFCGKMGRLLRLKNIFYVDGSFMKQEVAYFLPTALDKLISDMMELSLSYAILWVDTNIMGCKEIAVAKTAHNTTNIDADVMAALIQKIGSIDDKELEQW